jgi:hypothetical protein
MLVPAESVTDYVSQKTPRRILAWLPGFTQLGREPDLSIT